ncbi:MAG: hypothetical protein ROR55_10845 [Devosia sp.]
MNDQLTFIEHLVARPLWLTPFLEEDVMTRMTRREAMLRKTVAMAGATAAASAFTPEGASDEPSVPSRKDGFFRYDEGNALHGAL